MIKAEKEPKTMNSENQTKAVIQKLKWAILVNSLIVLIQAAGGFYSNSLGLLSDAGHTFADTAGLFLSCYAMIQILKPPTRTHTYGFHRSGTLAAFSNAILLALMTLVIFYEAFQRFLHPMPVNGPLMYSVAALALVGNTLVALTFRKIKDAEMNAKTAYLHMASDALVSLGVIVAGVVVTYTGLTFLDPLIGAVIGVTILYGTLDIFRESIAILMEGAPSQISAEQVSRSISELEGVREILDIHLWTAGSGIHLLTCRILTTEISSRQNRTLRETIRKVVSERHHIDHATIELETAPLPDGEKNCCFTKESQTGSPTGNV